MHITTQDILTSSEPEKQSDEKNHSTFTLTLEILNTLPEASIVSPNVYVTIL